MPTPVRGLLSSVLVLSAFSLAAHAADLPPIPADYAGLSFEMQDVVAAADGHHLFRPDNQPLIALFHQLNLHSLRVGGNTADRPSVPIPTPADIDSLFAFAKKVEAKVIFTLRLRGSDPTAAVPVARYIAAHYLDQVDSFSIGNEPNVYAKTYPEYKALLDRYLAAITAPDVAPKAVFCGPSTTPGKIEWVRDLERDFGSSGRFVAVTQHEYVGGNSNKVTDQAAARDRLLSPAMPAGYEKIRAALPPYGAAGSLPLRFEETNSFYNGGAKDVSNTQAAALWALDYLHWWALHGASGVNFHTGDWVAAGENQVRCWYATFWSVPEGVQVHPIGYALKAFALGGHGRPVAATAKPDGASDLVSAYKVLSGDGHLYTTLINKSHGASGRPATVALASTGFTPRRVIFLSAPGNDAAATSGITLGDAAIAADGSWAGRWSALTAGSVILPPATAAVVDSEPNP